MLIAVRNVNLSFASSAGGGEPAEVMPVNFLDVSAAAVASGGAAAEVMPAKFLDVSVAAAPLKPVFSLASPTSGIGYSPTDREIFVLEALHAPCTLQGVVAQLGALMRRGGVWYKHDPRLAMRPSSFNTGVEPSPAPPTATDLLEENRRISTGQATATSTATYSAATSLSSLRATQAQNPGSSAAPLGADGDPPPGTNESMLRAQLDYARALDFEGATLDELSEVTATLGEIRDIALPRLSLIHI